MLKDKLSHFYGDWNLVPDDGLAAVFARFVAAGQPRMVVHSGARFAIAPQSYYI